MSRKVTDKYYVAKQLLFRQHIFYQNGAIVIMNG
jgi:hypothetical protein